MFYLSRAQIAAAREMDLLTYLRRFEPEELVHIGGNTYATRTHDSLKISNGKWCWWSRSIGKCAGLSDEGEGHPLFGRRAAYSRRFAPSAAYTEAIHAA